MWKAHRTCAWGACAPGREYGKIQKERQADALPREKRKLVVIALQTRLRRTDTDMTKGSVLGRLVAFAVPLLIGNIFQQLYNMGAGILRAVGDTRRPLYFLIFSAVTNTVLDLLFVTVFHMGVAGVAIATILAQFASAVLVMVVLTRSTSDYRIVWRGMRLNKKMFGSICRLGFPAAVQLAVTSFSNIFVQSYINRFGADCMAGWTSHNKIDSFVLLPIMTISLAVTTFVGQNLGAGDQARARQGTRTALLLAEGVAVVLLVPLMLLSPQLISLFNQEPEVLRYGTLFIRIVSPFYLVICINQVLSGSLRGAGDSRNSVLIILASFVLFRQIYLAITYRVWGTVVAVALGYPAGWVLCSVLLLCYYRSGKWKKASIFKEKTQ